MLMPTRLKWNRYAVLYLVDIDEQNVSYQIPWVEVEGHDMLEPLAGPAEAEAPSNVKEHLLPLYTYVISRFGFS